MIDDFKNTRIKKVVSYDKLADLMRVSGYGYLTGEKCRSRYDYLYGLYKKIKDHNDNRSGVGHKNWEYFDIFEDIHKGTPHFAPVALASNLSGFKRAQLNEQFDEEEDFGEEENAGQDDDDVENFFGQGFLAIEQSRSKVNKRK